MGKLEGKVAVVTGAAFGNGRGIAVRFADGGITSGLYSGAVQGMLDADGSP